MKTVLATTAALLALSAPAFAAKSISYVVSASYVCTPESTNTYLKDAVTNQSLR